MILAKVLAQLKETVKQLKMPRLERWRRGATPALYRGSISRAQRVGLPVPETNKIKRSRYREQEEHWNISGWRRYRLAELEQSVPLCSGRCIGVGSDSRYSKG